MEGMKMSEDWKHVYETSSSLLPGAKVEAAGSSSFKNSILFFGLGVWLRLFHGLTSQ
jgi:hypothetical protein